MENNKKGFPSNLKVTSANDAAALRPFVSLSPMERERILTQLNTIGSKREIKNSNSLLKDPVSGRMETL